MKIIIINQAIEELSDKKPIAYVDTRGCIYTLKKLLTIVEGRDKQNYIIIVNLLRGQIILTKYSNKFKLLNVKTGITYHCYEDVKSLFIKHLS